MAYSAIEKMRKKNEQIYGRDVGPMQPALSVGAASWPQLPPEWRRRPHLSAEASS